MSVSNIEKINFSLNFKPVDLIPTIAQPQWQEATTSGSLRAKQRRLRQESALLAQAPLNIAPIQSTETEKINAVEETEFSNGLYSAYFEQLERLENNFKLALDEERFEDGISIIEEMESLKIGNPAHEPYYTDLMNRLLHHFALALDEKRFEDGMSIIEQIKRLGPHYHWGDLGNNHWGRPDRNDLQFVCWAGMLETLCYVESGEISKALNKIDQIIEFARIKYEEDASLGLDLDLQRIWKQKLHFYRAALLLADNHKELAFEELQIAGPPELFEMSRWRKKYHNFYNYPALRGNDALFYKYVESKMGCSLLRYPEINEIKIKSEDGSFEITELDQYDQVWLLFTSGKFKELKEMLEKTKSYQGFLPDCLAMLGEVDKALDLYVDLVSDFNNKPHSSIEETCKGGLLAGYALVRLLHGDKLEEIMKTFGPRDKLEFKIEYPVHLFELSTQS